MSFPAAPREEGVDTGSSSQAFEILQQEQQNSPTKVRNGAIDAGERIFDYLPLEFLLGWDVADYGMREACVIDKP